MSTRKILIVDDLPVNTKMRRQMLERIDGYIVSVAPQGKEAKDVSEIENLDLIHMDINIPE